MSPATRVLIEALIRLVRGMCTETEKWLRAQEAPPPKSS